MRLTVKHKGANAVIANIEKYDEDTRKRVAAVVNKSLKNIAMGARRRLPTSQTGNLRRGIKKKYVRKSTYGYVKATAPHSHLIEFGTKRHSLDRGARRKVMVINGNPVSGDIMHPGSKAKPFMQPAYYAEKNNYIANLEKAVKP